jgi:hypothetical protein
LDETPKDQFLGGKVQFLEFQVQVTNSWMNHQKSNFWVAISILGFLGSNHQFLDEPPKVQFLRGKVQFWDFQVQVTNSWMNHQKFNLRGGKVQFLQIIEILTLI